jgi:hypothetical protein
VSCDAPPDAFLEAHLAGAVNAVVNWRAADMRCDGMRRPDGQGLRVTFSGGQGAEQLTLVFGVPRLAEGAAGHEVPVNVTLIRAGHALYGTLGEGKCVLDEVRQEAMPAPSPAAAPATPPAEAIPAPRYWRIEARGFCLEPARAIGGGRGAILLSTFDFRGQVTWEPDAPPPATGAPVTTEAAVR